VKSNWIKTVLHLTLAAVLSLPAFGQPAAAVKTETKKAATKKADATPPPSAQDIAAAKAKGMVWVNLGTGVFHKDGEFYGKTKRGQFMTEADAVKAGHRAAKEPGASKKKAATSKDGAKK
jgi:hypothetical protein